jgi:hypothetical protein
VFCIFCSLYYNALSEGIGAGAMTLLYLMIFDNTTTKEIRSFNEVQIGYRRKVILLTGGLEGFLFLTLNIRDKYLIIGLIAGFILVMITIHHYQKEYNEIFKKDIVIIS